MAESEMRVRFRERVPMKQLRALRIPSDGGNLGDALDTLAIYLAGVDETEFADAQQALRYLENLTIEEFIPIANAFKEFREMRQIPLAMNGSSAPG